MPADAMAAHLEVELPAAGAGLPGSVPVEIHAAGARLAPVPHGAVEDVMHIADHPVSGRIVTDDAGLGIVAFMVSPQRTDIDEPDIVAAEHDARLGRVTALLQRIGAEAQVRGDPVTLESVRAQAAPNELEPLLLRHPGNDLPGDVPDRRQRPAPRLEHDGMLVPLADPLGKLTCVFVARRDRLASHAPSASGISSQSSR